MCLFLLKPGKNQAFVGMGGENKNNQQTGYTVNYFFQTFVFFF